MKQRYWLCKRGTVYFSFDSQTRKRDSLHTSDKEAAIRIVYAKNDATRQACINTTIAKAYLVGADPKLIERTWSVVLQEYCSRGKESTKLRNERAARSKPFNRIRDKKLIETTADDFRLVMKEGGNFTNHFLCRLHNFALGFGWILGPIIPPKLWPPVKRRSKRGITLAEHTKLVSKAKNSEWKLYFELLWEIGAAQTDAANLTTVNINWEKRLISYNRQKTGEICQLEMGPRIKAILRKLPSSGHLFPNISQIRDSWRSAEFRRRCRLLKIEGITLHSYRYAWAARAKQYGMPERFAQGALGHASTAVHREYAKEGLIICPSMEEYERKVVQLPTSASHNRSGTIAA